MKIVIFDFNRTLYDPDAKGLVRGTRLVLRTLTKRGFILYLVSRGNSRQALIKSLGIGSYFKEIIVSREKSKQDFEKITQQRNLDLASSFVIGDRARQEIKFGKYLGLKTIWIREGKFALEPPRRKDENPDFTVNELKSVLELIR